MEKSKPFIILGETILPGESKTIDMEIARLHTTTKLKIPIIYFIGIFLFQTFLLQIKP
jgi:hypothetical protein